MIKRNITEEQFTQAMREAVAERGPEYRSNNCMYVNHKNEPSCIIGVALHKCGIELPLLMKFEGLSAGHVMDEITDLPLKVRKAADHAQYYQDNLYPWSQVLKLYLSELEKE